MTSTDDHSTEDGSAEDSHTKSFLGHMEDLRSTIVRSILILAAGMAIAATQVPRIMGILVMPLEKAGYDVEAFLKLDSLTGGFYLLMQIAFWAGFVLAMGPIVWIVTLFVAPGLTFKEKSFVRNSAVAMVILFIIGVCMAYFMTIPVAIDMMGKINKWMGVEALFWKPADYIGFVLKLMVAFGLAFELPVVVLALGKMGIVSSRQLREKRRHVIVGLMVMAMLLTPSDPWTMLMMAAPLILLYEACIWIVHFRQKTDPEYDDLDDDDPDDDDLDDDDDSDDETEKKKD